MQCCFADSALGEAACSAYARPLHDELQGFAATAAAIITTVRNIPLHVPLLYFLVPLSPVEHCDHLAGWPEVVQVRLLTNSTLSPTYQNMKAVAALRKGR